MNLIRFDKKKSFKSYFNKNADFFLKQNYLYCQYGGY